MIWINTLRPEQNSHHFADDIFKYIFLTKNISILVNISISCAPNIQIDNIPALVQIMAWRRPGDKPSSEPMMFSLPTHICVIRSQWVIPPVHGGCDLCASLVRPKNWPGRRWRQEGGRTIALVVQGWYTARSYIAMDATVAVKFWACSKQSHKGRRGVRLLTGRSKEAGGRHTHT